MQKHKENISHPPSYYARKKFLKHKPAVFGLMFIILAVIVSVLGYLILPDSSPNANEMALQLNMLHPMTSIKVLKVRKDKEISSSNVFNKMINGAENPYTIIPLNSYLFNKDSLIIDVFTGLNNGKKLIKYYSIKDILPPGYKAFSNIDQEKEIEQHFI